MDKKENFFTGKTLLAPVRRVFYKRNEVIE